MKHETYNITKKRKDFKIFLVIIKIDQIRDDMNQTKPNLTKPNRKFQKHEEDHILQNALKFKLRYQLCTVKP